MTMINIQAETVRNAGFAINNGVMGRFKTFIARNRAERQLHQLDDRMLADIGISRSDIGARVWGA